MSYAPRILIVDDEPTVRNLLDRVLMEDGYLVTAVGTAREALQAVREVAFEVIILDMSLPDADGIDVLRQIHSDVPCAQILAYSGMMVGPMLTLARAAGAHATLTKPTTSKRLREAVYGLLDLGLRRRRAPRDIYSRQRMRTPPAAPGAKDGVRCTLRVGSLRTPSPVSAALCPPCRQAHRLAARDRPRDAHAAWRDQDVAGAQRDGQARFLCPALGNRSACRCRASAPWRHRKNGGLSHAAGRARGVSVAGGADCTHVNHAHIARNIGARSRRAKRRSTLPWLPPPASLPR